MKRQGLIAWFTRHRVAANLLMVFILVAGALSAWGIKKEFFPEIDLGAISVTMIYPGAAPAEVERGICIKIEEALQGLDGVKHIDATTYEGGGEITIHATRGTRVRDLLDRVKSRIDGIASFPQEAEKPVIEEVVLRQEVMWLILASTLDERRLKALAETIRDEMTSRDNISNVKIHGVRREEISVEVSEKNMRRFGLTFDEVTEAIRKGSVGLPGGRIKSAGGEILLRGRGKATTATQFSDILLRAGADGARVTLGDAAHVRDGFAEDNFFVRFQGKPAVAFQIFRVGDESTLSVARAVNDYIKERHASLPEKTVLVPVADTSKMLRDRLTLMLKNIIMGGLLVFLCLALFLQPALAFWVMAGLPVCFLGALFLMPLPPFGISINMLTLFGFILVLGIVVDDAIVIAENIHTTVKRHGPGARSVIKGASEVAMPATFGVLTTVAAFIPMLTIPGVNGKIWSGIALVVVLCLFFSLVESKLILPAHLLHLGRQKPQQKNGLARLRAMVDSGLRRFIDRIYGPLLRMAMKHRYTTAAIFVALLIVTAGLGRSGIVRFVFFPEIEADTIDTALTMADGSSLDTTLAAVRRIEGAAKAVNTDARRETGIQSDLIQQVVTVAFSKKEIYFYAELLPSEKRNMGSNEIIRRWRKKTGTIPGVKELKFTGKTADTGSPIDFQLEGHDTQKLHTVVAELKAHLANYDGVFDVRDTGQQGQRELRYRITPEGEALGIAMADLANWVHHGFHGAKAQTIQRGRHAVDVMVRYPYSARTSLDSIAQMRVRTHDGRTMPFSNLANLSWGTGAAEIHRSDGQRVVHVMADVDKSVREPEKIISQIEAEVLPGILERHSGVSYRIAGEAREQAATMDSMKRNAVLALLVIFALMAIPLNAYLQPVIIMTAIPFGIVGAVWGHWLVGLPVSVLSLCGIIALSGVVVNDSLVMVDMINRNRSRGMVLSRAVMASGTARFRAILLTSLTTFAGLCPMLMEKSLQAQFLIPMSVSLAFGIIFATVITLFLIPCLYMIGADSGRLIEQFRASLFRRSALLYQTATCSKKERIDS